MEWLTDPVWFGNYVIARWVALAIAFVVVTMTFAGLVAAAVLVWASIRWLGRLLSRVVHQTP